MTSQHTYFENAVNRFHNIIDLVNARADTYGAGYVPAPGTIAASSIFAAESSAAQPVHSKWGPTFSQIISRNIPPLYTVPDSLNPSSSIWDPSTPAIADMERADLEVSEYFHPITADSLDPRILRIIHSNREMAVLLSFMNTSNSSNVNLAFFTGENATPDNFQSLFNLTQGNPNDLDAVNVRRTLSPTIGRFANLHEALALLQYPLAIACAVVLYGQMVRYTTTDLFHPHDLSPWFLCTLPIITSRTIIVREGDEMFGHESIRHYQPTFTYEPNSDSVQNAVSSILASIRTLLPTKATSEFLVHLDKVIVTGFESLLFTRVPNGLHLPHQPQFTSVPDLLGGSIAPTRKLINTHTLVSRYLAQLFAFGAPAPCNYMELEVNSEAMPLQDDQLCILNSFIYLHTLQNGRIKGRRLTPSHAATTLRQVKQYIFETIPEDLFKSGNLMQNLELCIKSLDDPRIRMLLGPMKNNRTVICFLNSVSKASSPLYPMVTIDQTGTLSSSYPDFAYSIEDVPATDYILAYHRGHIFVTSMSRYLFMTSQRPGLRQSVYDFERELISPPDEFTMEAIDNERKLGRRMIERLKRKREHRDDVNMQEERENAIYDEAQNMNIMACDLETMQCPFCNIQEAACVSLRWGTGDHQHVTFVGQQCLADRQGKPNRGCLDDFFDFLKIRFGLSRDRVDFGDPIVKRAIGLFNGANFDHFFFFTYMSYMGWDFEVVPMDNSLVTISWGQYIFYDFAKLYPGASLDKLYKTFLPALSSLAVAEVPVGKWQCFPYGAIGIYTEIEIDMLNSRSDWGGKRCEDFPELSFVEANIAWWKREVGTHYNEEALKLYCLSDVDILFLCQLADFKKVATGRINGRSYSLTTCFTVASRSLTLWRSAFVPKSFHVASPSFNINTSVCYSQGTPCSLQEALRLSYQGGLVQRYYDRMIPPSLVPLISDYETRTGKLFTTHCFDFNSKYPHVMRSNPMPTKFLGEKVFTPSITLSSSDTCLDYYLNNGFLYHCSVTYPVDGCGIPCKFKGSTLMPNIVPERYYDPASRFQERLTFVWGYELREAIASGATVTLLSCQMFDSVKIFDTFIDYCYTQRTSTDDPVLKLFWKLMMNSLYGKFAQDLKPSNKIVYSLNEITNHDRLSSIRRMPSTRYGAPRFLVSEIPSGKGHIGCHVWWSSYITSCARADLMKSARLLRGCKSVLGCKAQVLYHDTDSLYTHDLDLSDPYTKHFIDTNVDVSRLGALKDETPDGIFNAFILGKKLLTYIMRTDEVAKLIRSDADAYMLEHPEIWKITAKGAHKKSVDPLDMMRVSLKNITSFKTTFPLRFVKSYLNGITRVEDAQRTVRSHDTSRQEPHPETGFCKPLDFPFFE